MIQGPQRPLEAGTHPRFTASKDTRTSVPEQQGTEFSQPALSRKQILPLGLWKETQLADTLIFSLVKPIPELWPLKL